MTRSSKRKARLEVVRKPKRNPKRKQKRKPVRKPLRNRAAPPRV
jgi:hypothetical protein